MHLYEDLIGVNRSSKLVEAAVNRKDRVLNVQNKRRGVEARRGDATFGEILPGETAIGDTGYLVHRGPIATVEIGVEVKILAKAMIKQIDRVINDLRNQVVQFKRGGGNPICVAVIGVNTAESTIGYEGDRPFPTTGKGGFLHPYPGSPGGGTAIACRRGGGIRRISRPPVHGNQCATVPFPLGRLPRDAAGLCGNSVSNQRPVSAAILATFPAQRSVASF